MAEMQAIYHSEKVQSKLRIIVPLTLMIASFPSVILFWYTNVALSGSFSKLFELFAVQGFFNTLYLVWSPIFFGTVNAWMIITTFALFQLLLMRIVPGKLFYGPITPKGNIPTYKANGVQCFLITLALFCLSSFYLKLFSPTIIYDNFGALLGALHIFSLFFCLLLYFKGKIAPSSSDSGSSGNPIFDFYWGMELYPRILGFDVKMFTNCRFGMMSWGLIILSFAAAQYENYGFLSDSMLVAVALQLIYITKFFIWETGYLRSLDIMHDRAGYYICWGCLVWVPGIYTSPTLYLVNHPNLLGAPLAWTIFILGAASIIINYLADRQRQKVRSSSGNCTIWGKKPTLTVASYITGEGELKQNILLASGWWGISRHFHYLPEIFGAFFWTLPALFNNFLPYFYVIYLIILLIERAFRDDRRCANKYGPDWSHYCAAVPYKIIPFII